MAVGCDTDGTQLACDQIADQFETITGTPPPWICPCTFTVERAIEAFGADTTLLFQDEESYTSLSLCFDGPDRTYFIAHLASTGSETIPTCLMVEDFVATEEFRYLTDPEVGACRDSLRSIATVWEGGINPIGGCSSF